MTYVYTLYWVSQDSGGFLRMNEYPSWGAAEAAIPESEAFLLSQCASERQRQGILSGYWDINPEEVS